MWHKSYTLGRCLEAANVFSVFFYTFWGLAFCFWASEGQAFWGEITPRLYNFYNCCPCPRAAHAPGQQLWTSLAPCSTQKALKQLKFDVEVKTWNPVSARLWDCHWQNLRRRKIWRVQEYKSTSVSPLTVSVLCKMAAETHLRGETESFHTLWYLQISPQIDWIFPREELDPFLGAQESRWRIFGISFLMTAF